MKPTPPDWPRISAGLVYADAPAAIDWLCSALGFSVRIRVEGEGGRIEHCELEYGEGVVMVGQEDPKAARGIKRRMRSPRSLGGAVTQALMIYVDDVEAHCARARAHGAQIVHEPETHDYGADHWADRSYGLVDPEGHTWWICQRLRTRSDAAAA